VTYQRGEGLTGHAWESGEPLCVRDFASDARATGPSAGLAAGKAALAGGAFIFPLISGAKAIGALCFSSAEVRAPEERLLRAVQVIGSQVAQFLQRKRGEEALRQTKRRFELFVDNAPCMVWFKDSSLRYTYVNTGWERTNKRSAKDVVGRPDSEIFPPELAQLVHSSDQEVLNAGDVVQRLRAIPQTWRDWHASDAALQHYLIVKFPLTDASGRLGVGGIGLDMTERVEAEELAQRYAADVRRLLSELVSAQESERRRLADELHDLIGQNLTAIGIDLSALKAMLSEDSSARVGGRLDAIAALLDGTVDAIRGVMTELRPAALQEFGLVPALRSHAADFGKRTGMKVSVSASSPARRLAPGTELSLFRIAQEALTNAAKHSGARSIRVAISEDASGIRMSIEDDGHGFRDPSGARAARRGGWGLQAMRERAEALGGTLRIELPGRGTRVVVELPPGHGD
jgi:two-component system, NarL family, sensor histidine kinase UhpB